MIRGRRDVLGALAACLGAAGAGRVLAANSGGQAPPPGERERAYFTDTVLTDQHGARLRFYSDVLRGRTVLVNFMFTGCSDACPLMTHQMVKTMEALGPDFGERIRFVSITVDPLGDSPAQLRAFAEKFDVPKAGWSFLTGQPADVQRVLQRLGERAKEPEVHTTLMLAGNVDARHWRKLNPPTRPDRIAGALRDIAGIR